MAAASPAANFLKLVSLELGRGLDADEKAPPRPVNPSKLDCLVFAKALKGSFLVFASVVVLVDVTKQNAAEAAAATAAQFTSFSPELSWLEWEEVQVLLEVGRGVFVLSETSSNRFR